MTTSTGRERLTNCAQPLGSSDVAVSPMNDAAVIRCAQQAQLTPEQTVQFLSDFARNAKLGPTGVIQQLQRELAASRATQAADAQHRELWQERGFWLLLFTNYLTILFFTAAFFLVTCFIAAETRARDSVVRARRAVVDLEQNRTSFLAAAGHDLRQPIQAIELFLATLLQRTLEADVQAVLRKIEAATLSMKRMINGLLDIAKLDAGLVSTDNTEFELEILLSSLRGEFERLTDASGLKLSIATTTVIVQTDPVLFESILRNLLSNAIRYTKTGDVGIRVQQDGQTVTVSVHDTGVGIPHDKLDRIFEDFYRLDLIHSEGLGLGLGIVRRLCGLLQCEMSVVSRVGEGSQFSLTLPAGRRYDALDVAPPYAVDALGQRITALLIEDNVNVREALAGQLSCWDVDVVQAGNGSQARAKIKGPGLQTLDIIIADFHLPDDNGLRLFQELSGNLGRRPCLLITGATEEAELEKIRGSGYRWLPKPLDLVKFRDEVNRMLAQAADNRHATALSQEL